MLQRTEVQRMERELANANVTGDALLRKFRTASRGDMKLACALHGYFGEENNSYLPYLKSRIRPAAAELILAGRVAELAKLDELGLFTAAFIDECLEIAISACVPDSIIWLLKIKEHRFGFGIRELVL